MTFTFIVNYIYYPQVQICCRIQHVVEQKIGLHSYSQGRGHGAWLLDQNTPLIYLNGKIKTRIAIFFCLEPPELERD